jgi:hypothetical protein
MKKPIMESLGTNPLGILTFIVAPAILANASSARPV